MLKKKGEEQRKRVIESASYCLCTFGERGATFQAIAEHCQLSQASVVKYLKNRENIFPTVLNHWILRAKEITEDALDKGTSPEDKIRRYLQVSTELFFERTDICKIYLMLHYFAAFNERYKVINTEIKKVAQERLARIITEGIQTGRFKKVDPYLTAKTIHNTLVGYLVSTVTEIRKPADLALPKMMEDTCLSMILPG